MKLRKYLPQDKPFLRRICKETAWESYKTDENKLETVPVIFNDYFTEEEPENIFVLCNDENIPVGYIICSADSEKFARCMRGTYRPRVAALCPAVLAFFDGFMRQYDAIRDRPIHFHIDILPPYQRQGWGRKMIGALSAHLTSRGHRFLSVCGVSRRSAGYRVYAKLGFEEIADYGGDVVSLTKDLKKEANMTQKQRMEAGLLYDPADGEIMREQTPCARDLKEYNTLGLGDEARMRELLRRMLAEVGEGTYIQPPFYANWGGKHVHIGKGVYANFRLTLVDDAHIYIGDHTMIGPNVTLTTATHPISPALREKGIQYNKDIRIGKNVWIGAGATVLPGVTIGDNAVIGAGAVVTRDIPADVVAVGVPCRVMRAIGEHDLEYYDTDKPIDL